MAVVTLTMSALAMLLEGISTGALGSACNYCPDPLFHPEECVGRLLFAIINTTVIPLNVLPCPP